MIDVDLKRTEIIGQCDTSMAQIMGSYNQTFSGELRLQTNLAATRG